MTISKSLLAIGFAVSAILGGTAHAEKYTATLLPGEEAFVKPASHENKMNIYDVSCSDEVLGCDSCAAGSCGDTCGSCDLGCGCDSGCGDCCGLTFVGGVEATFLAPIRSGDTDFVRYDLVNSVNNQFTTGDDNVSIVPAPRLWLGFVNCYGWGAQVRYWELNDNALRNDPFVPYTTFPTLSGDTLGYSSVNSLQMYTLDLEVTKNFCVGCWDMQAGFGYRHAALESADTVAFQSVIAHGGGNNFYSATGSSLLNFEGDGLTFALSGSRPTCHCFELFWSARGSILFGTATSSSSTSAQAIGPGFSAGSSNIAIGEVDDELFIGEVQLGAQWTHGLPCANALFFFRGAFEYQYWDGVGAGSAANSFAEQTAVGGVAIQTQSGGNSSMDLVGFTIATGLTY